MSFLRKYRIELIIMAVTTFLFNVATLFLPPNFRGLSSYSFLFVLDVAVLALFLSVFTWTRLKKTVFLMLYWAPFTLLSCIVLLALFFPFPDWNVHVKVISVTLLFALLIAHFLLYIFILVIGLIRFFTKNRHVTNTLFVSGVLIAILIFGVCAVAPFYWTVAPKVVCAGISSAHIPKGFSGYKIVQLSDIHADYCINDRLLERTVDSINNLNPDIILITGDLVTYKADELYRFIPVLSRLKAPDGVYCVMGNHDYGTYYRWKTEEQREENSRKFLYCLEKLHWKLLRNESEYLICNHDTLILAGTENKCFHESHYPCEGDINAALQNISGKYPVIAMTHDPVYWEKELKRSRYPIIVTLSGHTHGMQIGYRTKHKEWGLYRVLNKYSSGLYKENERYLYINAGLGTVGFPFRIGLKPEITLLTLYHGGDQSEANNLIVR